MIKLTLDLEDLMVETFVPAPLTQEPTAVVPPVGYDTDPEGVSLCMKSCGGTCFPCR